MISQVCKAAPHCCGPVGSGSAGSQPEYFGNMSSSAVKVECVCGLDSLLQSCVTLGIKVDCGPVVVTSFQRVMIVLDSVA